MFRGPEENARVVWCEGWVQRAARDPRRAQRAADESRQGSVCKKKRFRCSFGVLKDFIVCVCKRSSSRRVSSAPMSLFSRSVPRLGESPPLPGTQREHGSSVSPTFSGEEREDGRLKTAL